MRPASTWRRRWSATCTALALAASFANAAAATTSSPDAPIVVGGLPYAATLDVSDADPALVDTACGPVDHTMWFSYEPTTTTDVLVDTAGSTYDTVLDVQVVDGGELLCVDDTASSTAARGVFTARAGMSYLVTVGRRVDGEAPGGEPAGLLPAAEGLTLEVRLEATRIQRRGAPNRSTTWTRGGSAQALQVLVDEPDEYRAQGVAIDVARSDARTHEDVDLTWRHHRIDHDKGTIVLEDWDAYASPGVATLDRTLDLAVARGTVWLQGRLCVIPLEDELHLADLGDEGPSEEGPCTVLGGELVEVDATVRGIGERSVMREVDRGGWDGARTLRVEQVTSRAGLADLRVGGTLQPFGFDQVDAELVYVHDRAMVRQR